ncbi:MAG: HlyD family efflux transporter periplasmic adaptor subunit [Phycisphaeraceae bacterium]|nr:HlyD family efflux transporter periplasmic adaptor subunit [Phycisphaeraceae bacterium]
MTESTTTPPRPPVAASHQGGATRADDADREQPAELMPAAERPPTHPEKRLAIWVRIGVGVGVLIVAVLIAGALISNRRQAIQMPVEETVLRVRGMQISPVPVDRATRLWEGFGMARARDHADISAEVSGRVIERGGNIDPGQPITPNDVLLRLDGADYLERLRSAQSNAHMLLAQLEALDIEQVSLERQIEQIDEQIRLTTWEIDRVQEALSGASATDLEVVRLRAALARLESERARIRQQAEVIPSRRAALLAEIDRNTHEVALAQRQYDRTTIHSPISGVLQSVDAQFGEWIQPGQKVARVVSLDRMEIPLRLPASAQGEIMPGTEVVVRAAGGGARLVRQEQWTARIARIAPEADTQARMVTVFLEVDQKPDGDNTSAQTNEPPRLLMPGRFVTATIPAHAGNGATLTVVPRRAVMDDRLWIAAKDADGVSRAQPRQVRVLYHIEARFPEFVAHETQWSVIGSGLEHGEVVIISNTDDLLPGSRVEILSADPAP